MNYFRQKSPQQRFLFILGVVMMLVYLAIGIGIIFFADSYIDPEKFKPEFRVAFGVVLIIYAIIRFSRLLNKKEII